MRKMKLLMLPVLVLLALLVGNITIPVLAWFDREYDGYLPGAPSNGRLGYTHGADVRAWTLEMRWNTTYYVRRDNSPRIDITADCDSGTGADHLDVVSYSSNLPGKSFQRWNDCGSIFVREEGEIFFDKNSISTTRTDYEATVIFQKKNPRVGGGAIDHSYQRSSGPDSKVCGSICGDLNHDWLAKSLFDASYNFIRFEPPKAGWTARLGTLRTYASELPAWEKQDTFTFAQPNVPFTVQVAKDGRHTRAYVEVDFSNHIHLQAYVRWNTDQAKLLSTNLDRPIYVKVTFRSPVSIIEAQKLVDAIGLRLEQTTFVGRNAEGQPYNGSTFSDGVDSVIRLGELESLWQEKKIQLDGVMVIEGFLTHGDALQMLLETPQVYLVDVTTEFALREIEAAGITNIQGIVVPSPYWELYLNWLSGQAK